MKRPEFRQGAESAAYLADQYPTTHPYRLGDCILGELNLRSAKPRRNQHRVQKSEQAFLHGAAVALAEMHRLSRNDSVIAEVADNLGVTITSAKEAGADPFDWQELKRAGVATGKEKRS